MKHRVLKRSLTQSNYGWLMLMKKVWIGAVLFMMLVFSNGSSGKIPAEVQATWLWDPLNLVVNQAATIAFLEQKNVNKVYVQIDRDIPSDVYRRFIEKASAEDIRVFALDGAPDWAAEKGDVGQDQLMAWLETFQAGSSELQKFGGIHLDVEPYLYSGWATDQKATILAYQNLLLKAKAGADSLVLPLEVDMPFWFDEVSYANTVGTGLLAEWVIANTSSVTIMAYRDKASSIIDLVRNEVEFAAEYGKTIVVGIETAPTDEGEGVSFYRKSEAYMTGELEKVQAHYRNVPGYGGIAVHQLESWKKMNP